MPRAPAPSRLEARVAVPGCSATAGYGVVRVSRAGSAMSDAEIETSRRAAGRRRSKVAAAGRQARSPWSSAAPPPPGAVLPAQKWRSPNRARGQSRAREMAVSRWPSSPPPWCCTPFPTRMGKISMTCTQKARSSRLRSRHRSGCVAALSASTWPGAVPDRRSDAPECL